MVFTYYRSTYKLHPTPPTVYLDRLASDVLLIYFDSPFHFTLYMSFVPLSSLDRHRHQGVLAIRTFLELFMPDESGSMGLKGR